jgi:hypothetical protein
MTEFVIRGYKYVYDKVSTIDFLWVWICSIYIHYTMGICRCFEPGGPQLTSEFYAACPCPDGLMQDET